MHRRLPPLALVVALLALVAPAVQAQQTGVLTGRVTDRATRAGIAAAQVRARPDAGAATTILTDAAGMYRMPLAPGRYSVVVTRVGHAPDSTANVMVAAGETRTHDVALGRLAVLDQVIVSGTPMPMKVQQAPVSIHVTQAGQMERRPTITPVDHLRTIPGVDATQGGLGQVNVVARGFNNAFSGSLLMMHDYRFAGVPSLRVNVPMMFTGTNEDIERIEVLLGPAAALYGPNSASGVMHIITKSPFTSKGTTLTLDGGERSVLRGSLRHAGTIGEKLGYKISGEIFRGDDWQYRDPAEPSTFPASSVPGRRGQPNARDFSLERQSGEFRLDYKPTTALELVTSYGFSNLRNGIELTGANGAAQVRDWKYQSVQQRVRWGRLFAQAFVNFSDAGNSDSLDTDGTFLLRTGQPIVDRSNVMVGQLQHALAVGERQTFVYGLDYIATNPSTEGTTHGLNEADDQTREIGGYLHSVTKLSDQWELTTAARVDQHDRIDGAFFSPRAALQFMPTDRSTFRLTYNRAYSTPGTFQMFLDLPQANTPFATVRAVGVNPEHGITFARNCTGGVGGLCMRTTNIIPGAAGGPNRVLPANAAAFYPVMVGAAIQGGLVAKLVAGGVPQPLAQAIAGRLAANAPATLGTQLRAFNPTDAAAGRDPFPTLVDPGAVRDIESLEPTFTTSYELGYKGTLARRLRVSVDGWFQQRRNFITPAQLLTPNVFGDQAQLGAHVAAQVAAVAGPAGVPAAQIAAIATQVTGALARIPVGTVTAEGALFQRPDVVFTYRNIAEQIEIFGADLGAGVSLTDRMGLSGTFSWVSDDRFEGIPGGNGQDLYLNAPKYKGSMTLDFQDENRGYGWELRGRYVDAFTVNSAVYFGRVPVGAFMDAGVNTTFDVGGRSLRWSVNGTNLLDRRVPTFVGVPDIGRLVMTRVQYSF